MRYEVIDPSDDFCKRARAFGIIAAEVDSVFRQLEPVQVHASSPWEAAEIYANQTHSKGHMTREFYLIRAFNTYGTEDVHFIEVEARVTVELKYTAHRIVFK